MCVDRAVGWGHPNGSGTTAMRTPLNKGFWLVIYTVFIAGMIFATATITMTTMRHS